MYVQKVTLVVFVPCAGGKSKKMAPSLLDKQEVHTHATPHPKIMVVQEFLARDHRELNVCRGVMVELLGGEREWVYVQTKEGRKGFIPRSHCMVLPPEAEIQQLNGDSGLTASFDVLNENVNTNHCISPVRPSSADFHDRLPSHSTPFMFEDKRHGKRSSTSSNPSDWVEKRFSTTSKELSQTVRRSLTDGVDHHCSPGLTQNGLETRLSESDLQKLRCRPLPSLPDSGHTLKDEDAPCSPYHTIHRDSSLSPEPPLQGEVRETTPYADPFLLNSVSRQRHASVSEIRRRKCTIDATSPIYRTSSDEPNVHGRYSTGCCISNQELTSTEVHSEVSRFRKVVWGVFVAISDFRAVDENEISIVKGEKVSLLNHDDPDWHWVVRLGNSEEGFVPKNCLREHLAGQPEPGRCCVWIDRMLVHATVGVCKWSGTLIVGGGGCATYWLVLCSVDSRSTMNIRASFSL